MPDTFTIVTRVWNTDGMQHIRREHEDGTLISEQSLPIECAPYALTAFAPLPKRLQPEADNA
jgi:hypothetical protein